MIDKPNVLIRVHKDGLILYSVRISLVLSCPMHLQVFNILFLFNVFFKVLSNGRANLPH